MKWKKPNRTAATALTLIDAALALRDEAKRLEYSRQFYRWFYLEGDSITDENDFTRWYNAERLTVMRSS